MKRVVQSSTTNRTSRDYIKVQLFDYLTTTEGLFIGGRDAVHVIDGIESLAPVYGVDDVIDVAYEEGISIPQAIDVLKEELYG